jgi:hypothetical protein
MLARTLRFYWLGYPTLMHDSRNGVAARGLRAFTYVGQSSMFHLGRMEQTTPTSLQPSFMSMVPNPSHEL